MQENNWHRGIEKTRIREKAQEDGRDIFAPYLLSSGTKKRSNLKMENLLNCIYLYF